MNADDILFAPVVEQDKKEWYMKGEKVPDHMLKFQDSRVICRFGVDSEAVTDPTSGILWIYPLEYLEENESVIEIIYPENRFFSNSNHVIVSIDPHPDKRKSDHVSCANTEAIRESSP